MEIERLCCAQLEKVAMLGIGHGQSKIYFAHIQQFVSFLKGGIEQRAASRLLNTFLNSVDGQAMKESHGGDLVSATDRGSLDKMMYSFSHRGGSPSQFVNLEGMKILVNGIPGVDHDVKTKMNELCEGYPHFSFSKLTPEQAAKDDEEEVVEEIFNNSSYHGGDLMSGMSSNPERGVLESRLIYYRSIVDKEIMEERLKMKDVEQASVKERLDKEKLEQKLTHVAEMAARDAHAKELEKQLAIMQEREQARKEREQAVMEERERTMREARAKDELEKKLAVMEERARAKESETAAQLNAKEKELEWMKLQLEMEQRRKTMRPHVDVEDAGAPSDTSAPLQLVLTPFEDHIGSWTNAYRCNWFVLYSGHRAVTRADFNDLNFGNDNPVQVNQITSQQLEGGRWISLLTFVEKYMCSKVQDIVKGLYRKGSISGPVLTEVPFGATARFPIRALRSEALLRTAMDSPCKELVNGEWCCKVHAVVE